MKMNPISKADFVATAEKLASSGVPFVIYCDDKVINKELYKLDPPVRIYSEVVQK